MFAADLVTTMTAFDAVTCFVSVVFRDSGVVTTPAVPDCLDSLCNTCSQGAWRTDSSPQQTKEKRALLQLSHLQHTVSHLPAALSLPGI